MAASAVPYHWYLVVGMPGPPDCSPLGGGNSRSCHATTRERDRRRQPERPADPPPPGVHAPYLGKVYLSKEHKPWRWRPQ